ncbi:hypothetical protein [Mycoplasmopsis agassizii]|uniref:Uncharacterized protein n=1 Tax=Mycoplasmopsis agassizii TaxID=33922 RepID=A0ABX4H5J1_9BACT|nr:hypothetical protein [Mycoplasmopsis agassizii]PAF55155.1 hypothetical protein CJF60_00515 [Mycoplasmopsis agassizii]SMC16797.1 hypothetical protein SAMN02745179_00326 [Mycoplasmopsis agassizii]
MKKEKAKKFIKSNCGKTIDQLDKGYDLQEIKHKVTQVDQDGKILFEYSAEGTPKQFLPIIDPPPGPGGGGQELQWWQKWTIEQIKDAIGILRAEFKTENAQIRVEMKEGFEKIRAENKADNEQLRAENKTDNEQLRAEMNERFEKAEKQNKEANEQLRAEMNERFEKVEKQNKDTNEKLEAILELLKKDKK